MAIKVGNKYKCPFCNFTDGNATTVDSHRDKEHDFLLVPLMREDLNKLIMFIMTKDEKLISRDLYLTLKQYAKFRIKSREDSLENE